MRSSTPTKGLPSFLRRRPQKPPCWTLTFHWSWHSWNSRLGIAKVHLLVQAAQDMKRGVGVLLYKEMPSVDLVNYNDFNCHSIRKHELPLKKKTGVLFQLCITDTGKDLQEKENAERHLARLAAPVYHLLNHLISKQAPPTQQNPDQHCSKACACADAAASTFIFLPFHMFLL